MYKGLGVGSKTPVTAIPLLWTCFPLILFQSKCANQKEEVVQWLEFPPSLWRARAQCIRITRIHYCPAPLVDFALYFIALYSALKGALVCQNNPTIPGRASIHYCQDITIRRSCSSDQGWWFCKDFGRVSDFRFTRYITAKTPKIQWPHVYGGSQSEWFTFLSNLVKPTEQCIFCPFCWRWKNAVWGAWHTEGYKWLRWVGYLQAGLC